MTNVCDTASTNVSYVINDSVVVNKSMRPSSVGSNCLMHDSTIQGNSLYSSTLTSVETQSEGNDNTCSKQSSITVNDSLNDVSIAGNDQPAFSCTMDLSFKHKGFRIGHINIQGLNNKTDQVRLLLNSEQNNIQILSLSETKLRDLFLKLMVIRNHLEGIVKKMEEVAF